MPMGDASSVPPMNDGTDAMDGMAAQGDGMEPPMDNNNDAMGDDSNAMGGEPNAMGGMPQGDGMEPPMGGENEEDDSTMSIINKLSDVDKEAVRSYAESMLNRDESQEQNNFPEDASMEGQPMMEKLILKKRQIREINENFGPSQDELDKVSNDRKPLNKKKNNKISLNSPFNSPKFK